MIYVKFQSSLIFGNIFILYELNFQEDSGNPLKEKENEYFQK